MAGPHTDSTGADNDDLPAGFEQRIYLPGDSANVGGIYPTVFRQNISPDFYNYSLCFTEIPHNLVVRISYIVLRKSVVKPPTTYYSLISNH
jgi:hypothetical protein